jgi:DNA-directed RNA polymerase subunit F
MSNYEIISKEPISNAEVYDAITLRAKDEEVELTYREEKTLEYIRKFDPMTVADFESKVKAVEDLEIPRLDRDNIIKIVELMPRTGTELRAIVSHGGIILVEENATRVLEALN